MFMNACNIYITYFHPYQSMSSINYTHFIIIIINNKHVHIYIYHIIQHNQSSVNHRITSQGLHSTKQYTNRHTNRKLFIIELSRKITKQKFTHSTPYAYHMAHTRPYAFHPASYAYHTQS